MPKVTKSCKKCKWIGFKKELMNLETNGIKLFGCPACGSSKNIIDIKGGKNDKNKSK